MISTITNPTNSHKPLNPHAPPFPTKSVAAVVLPPLLPHQMHDQQFPVPAPQPAGVPVGFSCPPGQHMLWHTSVTFSPPIQRRDVYWVYSQPFWPNNSGGVGYSSAEEPFLSENAGMDTGLVRRENKLGASARRSVTRRKHMNGRRAIQQKKWTAKKPNADAVPLPSSSTSLMIKNIPNQFERHTLLNILDRHCLDENTKSSSGSDEPSFTKSEYDFTYLPMDFRRGANKGYAFVNFTSTVGAARFAKAFEKHQWRVSVNKKICEVTIANIQGKDALQNHFKNSAFPCRKTSYLPVVFSPPRDGFIRTPPTLVGKCV